MREDTPFLDFLFTGFLRWRILSFGTNPDGLDIHKFLDAKRGEFSPVATTLDATEGEAWV